MFDRLTYKWSGLLFLLLLAFLLEAQIGESVLTETVVMILFATSLTGSILIAHPNSLWRTVTLVIAGIWFVTTLATLSGVPLQGWATTSASLLVLGSLMSTFRLLLAAEESTLEVLQKAVFGYVLMILAWAIFYVQIERLRPGSFNLAEGADLWSALVFFSAVTMTTLGYGDILPVSNLARVLAGLQAIVGVLYVAVIVGSVVSNYKEMKPD